MKKIKFGEITITDTAKQHLKECLDANHVTMGPKTKLLEQKWSNLFGHKYTVAVSSGTSACMAANMSLYDFGASPGDEVIVPALSFIATANSIRAANFVPVFVDVKNDLMINEQLIEKAITPRTRAIMPVMLMGKPPKMDIIREIANKHNLKVIADNCLPSGQKVLTSNGYKNIESIMLEDKVITHEGRFRQVKKIFNKNYDGKLVKIKTASNYDYVTLTEDHPVLCCRTRDILKNGRVLAWLPAGEIKVGDYLVYPIHKEYEEISHIDFTKYEFAAKKTANLRFKRVFEQRQKKSIPVNIHLMNIIGWYLSEGWVQEGKSFVGFSLGVDEQDNLNLLIDSIKSFGFEYNLHYKNGNTVDVYLLHKQFSIFCKENFGNGASEKHLPEWIFKLNPDLKKRLLFSYFLGDGNKVANKIESYSASTVSYNLAYQLKYLCNSLDYFAGVTLLNEAGEGIICGRKVKIKKKYQIRFSVAKNNKFERRYHKDDNYFYLRVKNIKKYKKNCQVYNLEVDEDNSYLTPSFVTHNCEGHACRYLGKYMEEWADVVVYSAYAAHILFGCEMGLVTTNNSHIAEVVESIRSHGRKPGTLYFDHLRYGLNLKPTDLHASIGLGSIEDFSEIFDKRRKNWLYLKEHLAYLNDLFWFSDEDEGCITSPHGFSITVKPNDIVSCNGLKGVLDSNNIEWKRNFGSMPTQHCCFSYLGHKLGDFPIAEYIGDNGIHIGVHQFLASEEVERIVYAIRMYVGNNYEGY